MIKIPYIKDENNRRQELRDGSPAQNAGELNFQIFTYVKYCGNNTIQEGVIIAFIENFLDCKRNYQKYNDMIGCLLCCYKEIKRRLGINLDLLADISDSYDKEIADYEDKKIKENGDV